MSELPKKFGVDQLIVDKAHSVVMMSGEKSKRGIEIKGEFGPEGVYYNEKQKQWYMFLGDKNNPSDFVAIPSEVAKIVKTGLYIEKKVNEGKNFMSHDIIKILLIVIRQFIYRF